MQNTKFCKNCGKDVHEKFCEFCGQRTSINKVTFKETFQDFMDMVFSVNAPFVLTLKLLVINPGKLFREYLSGKRKTYYKPVSFFIITTIIYLVIRSLINYDPMASTEANGANKINGTLLLEAGRYMVANISNIMFLFVFAIGVFFKLFFYKKNLLAEFIAIAFYLVGFYTLLGTLVMFYQKFGNSDNKSIPIILFAFYILFAFISYFKKRSFVTIIKILFAYVLSFFFYSMLGFGLSFLIVWLKSVL